MIIWSISSKRTIRVHKRAFIWKCSTCKFFAFFSFWICIGAGWTLFKICWIFIWNCTNGAISIIRKSSKTISSFWAYLTYIWRIIITGWTWGICCSRIFFITKIRARLWSRITITIIAFFIIYFVSSCRTNRTFTWSFFRYITFRAFSATCWAIKWWKFSSITFFTFFTIYFRCTCWTNRTRRWAFFRYIASRTLSARYWTIKWRIISSATYFTLIIIYFTWTCWANRTKRWSFLRYIAFRAFGTRMRTT